MIKINKKLVSLLLIGTLMFAAAFFVACAEKNTTTAGGKTGAGGNTTDTLYEAEVFQLKIVQNGPTVVYSLDVAGPNEYTLKNMPTVDALGFHRAIITVTNEANPGAAYHLLSKVDFDQNDVSGVVSSFSGGDAKTALDTDFAVTALPTTAVIEQVVLNEANLLYTNAASHKNIDQDQINAVTADCGASRSETIGGITTTIGTTIICRYDSDGAASGSPAKLKGRTAYKVGTEAGDLVATTPNAKTKVREALADKVRTTPSFEFHVLEFKDAATQNAALVALATALKTATAATERAAALNAYVKAAARATTTATPVTLNVTADLSSLDPPPSN